MNTLLKAAVLGMSVLAIQSVSQAALLDMTKTYPDIESNYIGLYYTESTDTFYAKGGAPQLAFSTGNTTSISGGQFELIVTVGSNGQATGGTLTILGTVSSPELTSTTSTLLSGVLATNGFGYGGDLFHFIFNVNGGDAMGIMGPEVGVILTSNFTNSPGVDFAGTFTSDFGNVTQSGNYGNGTVDTFSIPEPTSIALLGLTGVVALRRKR